MDRRTLLKFAGASALAAATGPALIGCGSSGNGGNVGNAGTDLAPWPTYVRTPGPKADLVGEGEGAQDAFFRYPDKLVPSVSEKPGDGSEITAMIPTYSPPPQPVENNVLWQAINEALGVKLKLNLVPIAEYQQKLATLMAANDMPDIVLITGAVARIREFVAAKCADLTPHLSGDNVKPYPNLANIPTYSWRGMGRIGGKIYGIPITRGRMPGVLHVNRDQLNRVGAKDTWSEDEFVAAMKALTNGRNYGYGAISTDLGFPQFGMALGAPNNWAVDSAGAFTSSYEAPEYKRAIELAAKVYAAGVFHPTSLTGQLNDIMNVYYAGNVSSVLGSFYNYAQGIYINRVGNRFTTDIALPFGGKNTSWMGNGVFGYTVFKQAPADRIKLLLRICNFLAAPYGTTENELINYGVEGKHFTRGENGPTMLPLSAQENNNSVPIAKYICDSPDIIQVVGNEQATRRAFEIQSKLLTAGIVDASAGLSSPTYDRQYPALYQSMLDAMKSIVTGRADISSWDAAVQKFKDGGGKTIADELAKEYQANAE